MRLGPLERLMGQLARNITKRQLQEMEENSPHVYASDKGKLSPISFLVTVKKRHSLVSDYLQSLLETLEDVRDAEELRKTVLSFVEQHPNIDSYTPPSEEFSTSCLYRASREMAKAFDRIFLRMSQSIADKHLDIIRSISPISEAEKERATTGQKLFNALKSAGRIGPYDTELLHDIFHLMELAQPEQILKEYEEKYIFHPIPPAAPPAAPLPPHNPAFPLLNLRRVTTSGHPPQTPHPPPPHQNPSYPPLSSTPPLPPPQSQALPQSINSPRLVTAALQESVTGHAQLPLSLQSRAPSYRDDTYPRLHQPHISSLSPQPRHRSSPTTTAVASPSYGTTFSPVPATTTSEGDVSRIGGGGGEQLITNYSHRQSGPIHGKPQAFNRQISSSHSESHFPPSPSLGNPQQPFLPALPHPPPPPLLAGQPAHDDTQPQPVPSAPPPPPPVTLAQLPPHSSPHHTSSSASSNHTHSFPADEPCISLGNRTSFASPVLRQHAATLPPHPVGHVTQNPNPTQQSSRPQQQSSTSLPPPPLPVGNGRILTRRSRDINGPVSSNVLSRTQNLQQGTGHHQLVRPYQPGSVNNVLSQRELRACVNGSSNGDDHPSINASVHQEREEKENNQSSWSAAAGAVAHHQVPPTPPPSIAHSSSSPRPPGSLGSSRHPSLTSSQIVSPSSNHAVRYLSMVPSSNWGQYPFDPSTPSLVQRHELRRAEVPSNSFATISEEMNGRREEEEEQEEEEGRSSKSSESESSSEVSQRKKRLRGTREETTSGSSSSDEEEETNTTLTAKRPRTEEQKRSLMSSLLSIFSWKKKVEENEEEDTRSDDSENEFEDARD